MDKTVPVHVAIIPDGNRRWAKQHNLSVFEGHMRGMSSIQKLVYHAAKLGIPYLSFWGLSIDNLVKRNPKEVSGLLTIFHEQFVRLLNDSTIHKLEVKVRVLGKWRETFPKQVIRAIDAVQEATANYGKHNLTVFLAYNGTDEMRQAIQALADKATKRAIVVTPEMIKQYLLTADLPPVDLLIRTGGEPHLSAGFMMWDVADAELYFTPKFWPDFSEEEFDKALAEYASRERRRGK